MKTNEIIDKLDSLRKKILVKSGELHNEISSLDSEMLFAKTQWKSIRDKQSTIFSDSTEELWRDLPEIRDVELMGSSGSHIIKVNEKIIKKFLYGVYGKEGIFVFVDKAFTAMMNHLDDLKSMEIPIEELSPIEQAKSNLKEQFVQQLKKGRPKARQWKGTAALQIKGNKSLSQEERRMLNFYVEQLFSSLNNMDVAASKNKVQKTKPIVKKDLVIQREEDDDEKKV